MFAAELERLGQAVTVRWPRGRDISAACGQLKALAATQEQEQEMAVAPEDNVAFKYGGVMDQLKISHVRRNKKRPRKSIAPALGELFAASEKEEEEAEGGEDEDEKEEGRRTGGMESEKGRRRNQATPP